MSLPPLSLRFASTSLALAAGTCLGVAVSSRVQAAPTAYKLTTVGPVGASLRGINSRGQVAFNVGSRGSARPFLWTAEQGKALPVPRNTSSAFAAGINDKGLVSGVVHDKDELSFPTIFTPAPEVIPTPFGYWGLAGAINESRQVCGSLFSARETVPALWTPAGRKGSWKMIRGLKGGSALRVNNRGTVLLVDEKRSYLYEGGRLTRLPMLPGSEQNLAIDLNDAGLVCGAGTIPLPEAGPGLFRGTPCVWEKGKVEALPFPEKTSGWASGVNNKGQVCGVVSHEDGGWIPLLWEKQGGEWKVTDLTGLIPIPEGVALMMAVGINDRGQIIYDGKAQGKDRGFLATPAE